MVWQIAKIFIAAGSIGFTSWLAAKQPRIAGFLIALPLSSMVALVLFQVEYREPAQAVLFAKSILLAVPLSLLFFVPFLFADWLRWGFWSLYGSGVLLLMFGYLVHTALFSR